MRRKREVAMSVLVSFLVCSTVLSGYHAHKLTQENIRLKADASLAQAETIHVADRLSAVNQELHKMKQEATVSRGTTRPKLVLSKAEFDLTCRVIIAECKSEPFEGQRLVAQCMYDRLVSGKYGVDMTTVLTAPAQFASPFQGDITKHPDVISAVYSVFYQGDMPAANYEVLYFFNPETANKKAVERLRSAVYIKTVAHHEFRGLRRE